MFTPGSRACAYKTASGLGKWPNRDPIGEDGGLNLYQYVANNPINNIDPLGLALGDWYDPRTYANEGFLEGWSKGGQGVINDFTGGLFNSENGLFYNSFDQQDKNAFGSGIKCDSGFKFGSNAGRVAEGALLAAGAAMAAESAGLIDTSTQGNNVFRIMSKPLQRGFRIDKPEPGKWYHYHNWKW